MSRLSKLSSMGRIQGPIRPPAPPPELNLSTMTLEGSRSLPGHLQIAFSPTGSHMYQVHDTPSLGIRTWAMSAPFDVLGGLGLNETYTLPGILGTQTPDGSTLYFRDTGQQFYVFDQGTFNNAVFQYNLSTPWPNPLSSAQLSAQLSLNKQSERSAKFRPSGGAFYVFAQNGGNTVIRRWTLTTPWVLSSAASPTDRSLATDWPSSPFNQFHNFTFNQSGTRLYIYHGQKYISEYTLSTAWDTTTMTYTGQQRDLEALAGLNNNAGGQGCLLLDQELGKLWVGGSSTTDSVNKIYQFILN